VAAECAEAVTSEHSLIGQMEKPAWIRGQSRERGRVGSAFQVVDGEQYDRLFGVNTHACFTEAVAVVAKCDLAIRPQLVCASTADQICQRRPNVAGELERRILRVYCILAGRAHGQPEAG